MVKNHFEFNGFGGAIVPAVIWKPEHAKAVLQIAHGMTEHMGRYEAFAEKMTSHGVAVAGCDLRGHGRNIGNADALQ